MECPEHVRMPTGWPAAVLHWQALCPCVSTKAASWRTVVVGSFLAPQLRMGLSQMKSLRNLTRNQSQVRQVQIFIFIHLSTTSQISPMPHLEGVTWAVWAWLCILCKHKLNLLARPMLSQQHSWTDEMLLPLFGCGTGGEHPFQPLCYWSKCFAGLKELQFTYGCHCVLWIKAQAFTCVSVYE